MTLSEEGHELDLREYRTSVKNWGRENLRLFPWRETSDPYRLLMAEFMLLRTQAKQVKPVYLEFIEQYPALEELADASRSDIHDILSPLGLSWRADRVYETTQILSTEYGSTVPSAKEDLLSLPGISQYIAGAVRCFAFGKTEPLIDTNTVRITGRIFGLEVKDSSRRNSTFQHLIEEMVDPKEPRLYNLSMLDLGAKVCTSRSPNCTSCPLSGLCAYGERRIDSSSN